jgi:hypothetical protein
MQEYACKYKYASIKFDMLASIHNAERSTRLQADGAFFVMGDCHLAAISLWR